MQNTQAGMLIWGPGGHTMNSDASMDPPEQRPATAGVSLVHCLSLSDCRGRERGQHWRRAAGGGRRRWHQLCRFNENGVQSPPTPTHPPTLRTRAKCRPTSIQVNLGHHFAELEIIQPLPDLQQCLAELVAV